MTRTFIPLFYTPLLLFLLALITITSTLAAPPPEDVLLPPHRFDEGLTGWTRIGRIETALDPAMPFEGAPTARVRLAPPTAPEYQQIRRDFTTGFETGDTLRAQVAVRTQGLTGTHGAYMAVEFVDALGVRLGIGHSRVSADTGAKGWETINAEGKVPPRTAAVRLSLILHSQGTAWFAQPSLVRTQRAPHWPDLGGAVRGVTVYTKEIVHPRFGGVGFHNFQQAFPTTQRERDEVIYKRWRELAPTFVRVTDNQDWDRAKWDDVAIHLKEMQATNPGIYMTTWNPKPVTSDADMKAYAEHIADNMEYLYRGKGIRNIRWYCMTNEMSLAGWGKLLNDLPRFRAYHTAIRDALKRRNLPIGLLATDASPISNWTSIEWAAKNMDDVTAVYGGHHYINETPPDDETFYPWFAEKMKYGADIARARGKDFILGEFGSKIDGRTVDGVRLDRCVWFDTPMEPMVSIQIAEAAIAAVNSGVYALGYWTFMDLPDDPFGKGYLNQWGLFRCSGADRSTRDIYYAYGLLSRYFGGPAQVFRVDSGDPRLRVAAQRRESGVWSVIAVNRNKRDVPVNLTLDGMPLSARWRKFVYDPAHAPQNPFGDLQGPAATLTMSGGKLSDTVGAGTLTVYTTDFDETAPAPVAEVRNQTDGGNVIIRWRPSTEKDHCYYRVFRGDTQIGSTIATSFVDEKPAGEGPYRVVAVDRFGNAGR